MTVLSVFGGQVKPGRFDDVVEMGRAGAKIQERHGAKHPRLMTVSFASSDTFGSVTLISEFDGLKAFGTHFDKIMADEEIVRLMGELRGANSPFLSPQSFQLNEISLGSGSDDARGKVVSVSRFHLERGRLKQAVEEATAMRDYYVAHGALNHRMWVYYAAGPLTGAVMESTEYDSMEAYGATSESILSDREGWHLLKRAMSANSPLTMLGSVVYTQIPL